MIYDYTPHTFGECTHTSIFTLDIENKFLNKTSLFKSNVFSLVLEKV